MKLIKQVTNKRGSKEYSSYLIVLPAKYVKKLGWKKGDELEATVKENDLMSKPVLLIKQF